MEKPPDPAYPYVLSYRALRTSMGLICLGLPIALILGGWVIDRPGILSSISAYYYSSMRDVFVGSLCAAGVFLLSYRFTLLDDLLADVAGIAAFGIALFPTPPDGVITPQQRVIGYVHSVSTAVFLVALALFALFLFQRLDPGKRPTKQKQRRNAIYCGCGMVMVACLLLLLTDLFFLQDVQWVRSLNPGFSLETLALCAFGVAWFVKGGKLIPPPLKDPPPLTEP